MTTFAVLQKIRVIRVIRCKKLTYLLITPQNTGEPQFFVDSGYIILHQIENIWIRPALMGWQLNLHPAFIFVGVGVFSSLALH